jgi:hypothetical protein
VTGGRAGAVLTLLGKPDCALCHEMQEVVEPVLSEYGASLEVRDIREDAEAFARYRFEIPVLLLDGREIARHRLTADALRELLARSGVAPLRP